MKDNSRPRSAAAEILAQAKEQVPGQTMKSANVEKAQGLGAQLDQRDAAAFTEEIISLLNEKWNERGFTPEQRIFSLSLATINFRQHFPDDKGGKDFFDTISKTAWEYFSKNSG